MARIPEVELKLQRWAQWIAEGDGDGFPAMSVLHRSWQPPSPGTTPSLKVGCNDDDARRTHRAVGRLSVRLSNTLIVHYVKRLPLVDQAAELQCAESTVIARIDLAHVRLRADPWLVFATN
jgi:DNA-directed RNA polymerase specialized sigma24 family protein